MLVELGLGASVVGVSHQCDNAVTRGKPVVTSSTIPSAGADGPGASSPGEVDRAVTRAVGAGQPLYRTDLDLLGRLAPDVVVAQDVCDVCAVGGEEVRDELPPGAELVTLEATTLSGLREDVVRLGKAAGAEDPALETLARLRAGVDAVADSVAGLTRRRALVLEWGDPPFIGGHWVPELVEAAGGAHLLSAAGQASRRASWEEIVTARPDVVVFSPCGYTLAAAAAEARAVRSRLGPDTELWATQATHLFSRCTPRAVLGAVRLLCGIFFPSEAPCPEEGSASRV